MKRFFLSFFIVLGFSLFFYKTPVYSRNGIPSTPTPLPPLDITDEILIPGINCGDARNPSINACCKDTDTKPINEYIEDKFPDVGCLVTFSALGVDIVSLCLSTIIKIPAVWIAEHPLVEKGIEWSLRLRENCVYGTPKTSPSGSGCFCVDEEQLGVLCRDYLLGSEEYGRCINCSQNNKGVWTSIGCVKTDYKEFIEETLLGWMVGIASGVALLCIIYSAFVMQTSAGDPERLKKARQNLTSCIIGLLFIIFAVFILRLIGLEILKIPGFEP